MKKICGILLVMGAIISSCSKETGFKEIIIDNDGPQDLWMKSAGDMNADGKTDLLAGGWGKGGMVAYLAPEWKKIVLNDTLKISTDAEVCDLDGNKTPEIVAIAQNALIWLESPDWKLHLIDSLELHDIEVNDFDNDGLTDVIGRNQAEWGRGDTLYIFQQKPLGKFTRYSVTIANGEGLKSSDINGDNKPDIILNGFWLENTGDIRNWPEHAFSNSWVWRNTFIDAADINRDGMPDIVLSPSELAGNRYHVSWFEAPKDYTTIWKEHIVIDTIETVVHFIGAADFNLDGKMDIMIAQMQQGADPDEVAILFQQEGIRWKKQVISKGGSHSIRLSDFDGDGDTDAFGGNWEDNVVKMWVNETRTGK